MWTSLEDIKRPAFEIDVTKQITSFRLPDGLEQTDPEYFDWFSGNNIGSYADLSSGYPWTRMGYTYDWSGKEYGLTEFLIAHDKTVTVEYTKTVDEFIAYLQNPEPMIS
jgi:hypothetical protein